MAPSATVDEESAEQVGTALRRLTQELVAERRRLALLERQNRELKAQLERAEEAAARARRPERG